MQSLSSYFKYAWLKSMPANEFKSDFWMAEIRHQCTAKQLSWTSFFRRHNRKQLALDAI